MFVQVIEGRTADPDGLRAQFDKWLQELKPGAVGFLGSTGGVAEDRQVIVCARFESEAAAMANSGRSEQSAWWTETEKYFIEKPSFRNTSDVETQMGGGSDDAGFVQIMRGSIKDRKRFSELNSAFSAQLPEHRPDILGSTTLWFGDDFLDVVYFRSESEAREGEKKDLPGELKAAFEEFASLAGDVEYLDLRDPWLRSG